MESKVLKQIKKYMLEFFIIILVIGFFSRSFANYTLPKVTSVPVYPGNYVKSIGIEGRLEYKEVQRVRLGTSVVIEEYFVEPGKYVEVGTPIFKVNPYYLLEQIALMQDAKQRTAQLQEKLKLLSGPTTNQFFSRLGPDGIYYAQKEGTVVSINKTDQIISGEEVVVEIGSGKDRRHDLRFEGYLDEAYGFYFDTEQVTDIYCDEIKGRLMVKITNMYYLHEKNAYKIEGDLIQEATKNFIVMRNYQGTIRIVQPSPTIIPKSAIIAPEIKEGAQGKVYLLQTTQGILGREDTVKEVEVTIVGVGDNNIGIEGLDEYTNPRLITNLSYKIRDGVKVFHGS